MYQSAIDQLRCNQLVFFLCNLQQNIWSFKSLELSLTPPIVLLNDITLLRCRTRKNVLLVDHIPWSPFRPWRLAVIIAIHCVLGILTSIWAVPLLFRTFQVMSTDIKLLLWCGCTQRVHNPILSTDAVPYLLGCEPACLKNGVAAHRLFMYLPIFIREKLSVLLCSKTDDTKTIQYGLP